MKEDFFMKHFLKIFFGFILSTFIIGVIGVTYILNEAADTASHHRNASKWAESMGIKDPKINCDRSATCGCTIRYVDESKTDHVIGLACCGDGCEIPYTTYPRH